MGADWASAGAVLITAFVTWCTYVFSVRAQRKQAIFQGRLDRVLSQISQLYGPVLLRLQAGNSAWLRLRAQHGAGGAQGTSFFEASAYATDEWTRHDVIVHARTIFLPLHEPLRQLIVDNIHLIWDETGIPPHLEKLVSRIQVVRGIVDQLDVESVGPVDGLNGREAYNGKYIQHLESALREFPSKTLIYFKVYHFMLRAFRAYLLSNQKVNVKPYCDISAKKHIQEQYERQRAELVKDGPGDMKPEAVVKESDSCMKAFLNALTPEGIICGTRGAQPGGVQSQDTADAQCTLKVELGGSVRASEQPVG